MVKSNFEKLIRDIPSLGWFPRAELFSGPTILEPLENLSINLGVNLFIKRDDTLPLAMGGNKVRQLEYYLGEAINQKADTILITGSVQSNFARLCAAAARKFGMKPIVQLEKRVPKSNLEYNRSGNVLLLKMLGAKIVYFSEGENEKQADENLNIIADKLRKDGANPYIIHLGIDHRPLGALGYTAAAVETIQQANEVKLEIDHIVLPTGSALTHSGFLAGKSIMKHPATIHGICVRRASSLQTERVLRRTNEVGELLGYPNLVGVDAVNTDDTCLPPGYGRLNNYVSEAIKMSALEEGIILDPVYSGKAFAGLIYLIRSRVISSGQNVLFLHTGGVPANFGYQSELEPLYGSSENNLRVGGLSPSSSTNPLQQ